ncbi:MAG TPA: hypothetical protein ENK31_08075 [Nannocystis exedens]|nr:hypothetical protein [Nannocystis exedens]
MKLGRITIHTPGECPDFSGVSYAKGHLLIRGGVGQDGLATIPLIDLGDLIEMKYPSSIKAPLVPRRIVARHLTHVSELHIGQGVPQAVCQLDFPALTNLKHGTFYLQQLSLPSLREVETLTVHVSDRLHLELPQLVKGKVNIVLSKPNIDTRLVKIVAPRLRTQLEIGTSDPRAFDKKRLDAARRRIIRQFKDPAFHEMLLARMADTKSE